MSGVHTTLRVKLYGETIYCHNAADTVFEVLKKLIYQFGGEKVMEADRNPRTYKQRLISKSTLTREAVSDLQYGEYYISRDYNNKNKKRLLEDIAERLGVQILVEIIPK